MKILKTVIKIIGGILLVSLVILSILGYYLTRNDFSDPPEHYVPIGKRVYTTAPAMMLNALYDSLNLSGRGIKIGVLDTGFGGLRQRSWTKNMHVAAYANFIDGDTTVNGNDKCTDFGNLECSDFGNSNAPISVTTIHNFR